jgi:hypothetical protein
LNKVHKKEPSKLEGSDHTQVSMKIWRIFQRLYLNSLQLSEDKQYLQMLQCPQDQVPF